MPIQCVILAGGRGTRMASYTEQLPKALIPVCGKPFIDFLLDHLAKTGITEVILSIGYKGDLIRQHIQDGKSWGLQVRYVDEGKDLKGTGGALKLAMDQGVLEPAFLLTYGDALLPIDFSQVWRYFQGRSESILMTVFKNENRWEPSNASFDGTKVRYEKGATKEDPARQFQDYGVLAIRRSVIQSDIPAGRCDLAEVLKARSAAGDVAGMEVHTRPYQIGTPEGMNQLSHYIQDTFSK
jgi:MurNAc alpha-1-phosphate uridylyltransferase